ncbi:LysR family transcriptional regulator [Marinobacter sp. tcs-11]|uniref:LysR family transcriptional regulator n=1 Tax=Marinobacter sp. tcs-11 TaxID=1742860 RepID=UPI00257E6A20|nr:LysR family transcriptional regulator [Marinobacter sp. tcs-11]
MASVEQIFLQVVESGSLKAAAELLGVEPSSVSRKIAALEKRLAVKLLRRSTQRSTPTELGQRYYDRLRLIVDEQAALEEEIRGGVAQLQGTLRIAAPADFGVQFVVPVVRNMQQRASDLSVELLLGSHFENLVEQNIDVAVRVGELSDSSLYAKPLGDNPRVIVASPQYLARRGTPKVLSELDDHEFILYSPGQGRAPISFADGRHHSVEYLKANITVNSAAAVRTLVLDGAGIHHGPLWLFREEIEQGKLIQLFPDQALKAFPIHAVYPSRSYLPFKVKEFIRLMSQQMKDIRRDSRKGGEYET